jgi:lipoyl(octanoyl) transferase
MDLTPFTYINPCGYAGLQTTQLVDLLDKPEGDLLQSAQDRLLHVLQAKLL